jgi:predicted nuclease of predicted toxin-antitoxin system
MKLLLDSCVWGKSRAALEASGHDVVWAGDWEEDPGNEEILSRAAAEGRVLVTLDKDFGELAIVRDVSHCGILRLVNFSARQQAVTCMRALTLYGEELQRAAIVTAELGRFRVRPPDEKSKEY